MDFGQENNENIENKSINLNNEVDIDEAIANLQKMTQGSENEMDNDFSSDVLPNLAHLEDINQGDSVVKKYIIYISKEFENIIDNMSQDERSAYINDAIQKKLDLEKEKNEHKQKRIVFLHVLVATITLLITLPFAILCVNKVILTTFDNYKYSQDNFEKLYKHRFDKQKVHKHNMQKYSINNK